MKTAENHGQKPEVLNRPLGYVIKIYYLTPAIFKLRDK